LQILSCKLNMHFEDCAPVGTCECAEDGRSTSSPVPGLEQVLVEVLCVSLLVVSAVVWRFQFSQASMQDYL